MTAAPIPDRPAWANAAYERQLATLARLTEMGMTIGGAIEGRAKTLNAEDAGPPSSEILRAFEVFPRIARAVRLTLMLEDKVIRHMLGEDRAEPGPDAKRAYEPITEICRTIIAPRPRPEVGTSESGEHRDREERGDLLPAQTFDEAADTLRQDLKAASVYNRAYPDERPPGPRSSAGGRSSSGGGWGL